MSRRIHLRTSGYGTFGGKKGKTRESTGAYCFGRTAGRLVTITDDPSLVTCERCLTKLRWVQGVNELYRKV